MCWNQYVSINTFVFGLFVLLLIAFNNRYSSYKLDFFVNDYAYLFILSVITMQLIEFVLWRNINNTNINKIVSTIGLILLCIQPFTSLLLIGNIKLRDKLILFYSIPALIFLIYTIFTTNIHTVISKSGHLGWNWTNNNLTPVMRNIISLFYFVFLLFPMIYIKYYEAFISLVLYFSIKYYYTNDRSLNSLWCFSVNALMLYFLIQILLILPFNEITSDNR